MIDKYLEIIEEIKAKFILLKRKVREINNSNDLTDLDIIHLDLDIDSYYFGLMHYIKEIDEFCNHCKKLIYKFEELKKFIDENINEEIEIFFELNNLRDYYNRLTNRIKDNKILKDKIRERLIYEIKNLDKYSNENE